ncbi:SAICAR synthase-like protein [Metschnikowia bicuspidata var. bicuspidata NRRL YB-4993]|uniref:Kinase n=1 Tax=Metschnikowia bicuspidata var. bicuspidata NRRL YB-4993 TaxID=869754 RepID=A0A1A0HHR6_9ASCO|nr:SAICAR synthase-like protein [Metschnikowia bicuspidata var. bicuspidata NRRL YB-4993]OBA23546.1 SAICAR synthase-like protein [Metschnikowia bicuspidata var. bicuspidata NRRL YB-4993]
MNFTPSVHQAAGHDGALTAGPVFAKLLSPQEISFYAQASSRLSAEPELLGSQLAHWMPTYMGTMNEGFERVEGAMVLDPDGVSSSVNPAVSAPDLPAVSAPDLPAGLENPYLVLLNLYHRFVHPCILDIKLGSVLTDDTVLLEKKARLEAVSKATTSGSLGFRICGMKIFSQTPLNPAPLFPDMDATMHTEAIEDGGLYTSFDKIFGRSLDKSSVGKGLGLFFLVEPQVHDLLLSRFVQRLQLLYNCLLDAEVRIKSGSLLFIYEGDPARWAGVNGDSYTEADPLVCDPFYAVDSGADSDADSDVESDFEHRKAPLSRLNLIDFAHAKYAPGKGPDDNILDGLENLLDVFCRLADLA